MSFERVSILGSGGILPLLLLACSSQSAGDPARQGDWSVQNERAESNAIGSQTEPLEPLIGSTVEKWAHKLEKPPRFEHTPGTDEKGSLQDYRVTVRVGEVQMLPPDTPSKFPKTKAFTYGGRVTRDGSTTSVEYTSPGPTFEMTRDTRARVAWINEIREPHLFTVDAMPHLPPGAQTKVPYVTHLHGLEVESASDGSPEGWFTADNGPTGVDFKSNVYLYPNSQPPTTLWYHDHTIAMTRLNVYAGLAGMYVIRDAQDEIESALPSGTYEMPLVIQDKSFNTDGSLAYNFGFGDTNVVNGKVWPVMDVQRTRYRFRVLNGANSRFYDLGLSSGKSFTIIGSDGGYLEAPASVESVLLSPGERADILVDFSELKAGEFVTLIDKSAGADDAMREVVRFNVPTEALPQPAPPQLPAVLNTIPTLTRASTRTVTLHYGDNGNSLLDGQAFHGKLSEEPQVGATEDWDIVNISGERHPIHIHLVQFQVIGRQDIEAADYEAAWKLANRSAPTPLNDPTVKVPVNDYLMEGTFTGPRPSETGWKDTVVVEANSVTRIRIRWAPQEAPATTVAGRNEFPFDPTTGPGYVWHCHILEHEDMDMMRPLKVRP